MQALLKLANLTNDKDAHALARGIVAAGFMASVRVPTETDNKFRIRIEREDEPAILRMLSRLIEELL